MNIDKYIEEVKIGCREHWCGTCETKLEFTVLANFNESKEEVETLLRIVEAQGKVVEEAKKVNPWSEQLHKALSNLEGVLSND